MLTVELANPDFLMSDSALFNPGAPLDVYMGYGDNTKFIGRGEIVRHRPSFPNDGVPTLTIKAYDISYKMGKPKSKQSGGNQPTKEGAGLHAGGEHRKGTVGAIVRNIMRDYGIEPYVDSLVDGTLDDFAQERGKTDLDILRGMANVRSAWLYFAYEPSESGPKIGRWGGHFILPASIDQKKKYTFKWGQGPDSTLSSISIEFGIEAAVSTIETLIWNRKKGDWVAVIVEDPLAVQKAKAKGGKAKVPTYIQSFSGPEYGGDPGKLALETYKNADGLDSMTAAGVEAGGFRFDIMTSRLRDPAMALAFSKAWFLAHQDSMIVAEGSLIGLEDLHAGQIHRIEGVGQRYSGDYYFATVKHRWGQDTGYITSFTARKVLEEAPPGTLGDFNTSLPSGVA